MIISFKNRGTEDIYEGRGTKAARRTLPDALWFTARDHFDQLNAARALDDLRLPPSNRLEKLRGDRTGQWSIRINDRYRVCFEWRDGDAYDTEIVDYH